MAAPTAGGTPYSLCPQRQCLSGALTFPPCSLGPYLRSRWPCRPPVAWLDLLFVPQIGLSTLRPSAIRSFHLSYNDSSESLLVNTYWGTWEIIDLPHALRDSFWEAWVISGSLQDCLIPDFQVGMARNLLHPLLLKPISHDTLHSRDLTQERADWIVPLEYNSLLSLTSLPSHGVFKSPLYGSNAALLLTSQSVALKISTFSLPNFCFSD